jgi:hypothetical protein
MAVRRVLVIANETSEPRLTEDVRARFALPVTEILLDRRGRVAAVSAE